MGRGEVWVYHRASLVSAPRGGLGWEAPSSSSGASHAFSQLKHRLSSLFDAGLLCLPTDPARGWGLLGAKPHPSSGRGSRCRETGLSHGATHGLLSCMAFYSYVIIHPTSYRD